MTGGTPLYWKTDGDGVRCLLCPHACHIDPGETGLCGMRSAESGKEPRLVLPAYGRITAESLDPIEKKPLYHVLPGMPVWSIGFAGCNLHCPFCQNHGIARAPAGSGRFRSPAETVARAQATGAMMIAYTYSEPSIHIEYVMDTARLAAEAGLLNILVTNGNLNPRPARDLLDRMDAVNVDLKAWDPTYYAEILGGRLDTVREFISEACRRSWVEVTTLVVPGDNDDLDDIGSMARWIAGLSPNIPYHLSAYHPAHRYTRPPTAESVIRRAADRAREYLNFVYPGNTGFEAHTECPACGQPVIRRRWFRSESLLENGHCPDCGAALPGLFSVDQT